MSFSLVIEWSSVALVVISFNIFKSHLNFFAVSELASQVELISPQLPAIIKRHFGNLLNFYARSSAFLVREDRFSGSAMVYDGLQPFQPLSLPLKSSFPISSMNLAQSSDRFSFPNQNQNVELAHSSYTPRQAVLRDKFATSQPLAEDAPLDSFLLPEIENMVMDARATNVIADTENITTRLRSLSTTPPSISLSSQNASTSRVEWSDEQIFASNLSTQRSYSEPYVNGVGESFQS